MEGSFDLSHDAFHCAPPDKNISRRSVHHRADGREGGVGKERERGGQTIVSEFEQTNTSLSDRELHLRRNMEVMISG